MYCTVSLLAMLQHSGPESIMTSRLWRSDYFVQHCHGRIRAEIMEERNLISEMGVDRSLFAAYR